MQRPARLCDAPELCELIEKEPPIPLSALVFQTIIQMQFVKGFIGEGIGQHVQIMHNIDAITRIHVKGHKTFPSLVTP